MDISKDEIRKKKINDLQIIIDTAARLNRLTSNEDFQFFINKIKNKQRQYDNILHNPRQIGFVQRKTINLGGNVQYMDFKFTKEDNDARLYEASIRFDTFERVIKLVSDFNDEALRAKQLLEKLAENINIPKKSV